MTQYLQKSYPGVLDSDGLAEWMTIRAGGQSKFKQINMVGEIYDKNNIEILGGGGGNTNTLSLLQSKNISSQLYTYNASGITLTNLESTLQIGTNVTLLPDGSGIRVLSSERQHVRMNLNLTISSVSQTIVVFYMESNGSNSSPPDTISIGANLPNSSSIDYMVELTSFPCDIKPIIFPVIPTDITVSSCIFSVNEI